MAGLQSGVARFDSSAGGLGDCPLAPGATGNVATEDVLYILPGMGIETGIDLERVRNASPFIGAILDSRGARRFTSVPGARSRRQAGRRGGSVRCKPRESARRRAGWPMLSNVDGAPRHSQYSRWIGLPV